MACLFVCRLAVPKTSPVQYQTAPVRRGTIIATKTETGNVTASDQLAVQSPVTGVIRDIYVKNGDTVSAGANLFTVDATATPQQSASAYATYMNAVNAADTARAAKLSAQATLEKDRQAVIDASSAVTAMQNNLNISYPNPATKQPYTQNEIDSLKSAYTGALEAFSADEARFRDADTAISSAQAQVNAMWLSYRATQSQTVTAPVSGTVANLSATKGTSVGQSGQAAAATAGNTSSTASTGPSGTTVLLIGNFSALSVTAQVAEADMPALAVGQQATVSLDAFPGKTFVGTVGRMDTVGTQNSGVMQYGVAVSFLSAPPGILPGMSASVSIQTSRRDDTLIVPSAAVQATAGQQTVRVLTDANAISVVPVETGISSDTETEILSGLSEGQTVVTGTSGVQSASGTRSPFSGGLGGFGRGGR